MISVFQDTTAKLSCSEVHRHTPRKHFVDTVAVVIHFMDHRMKHHVMIE